MGWAGALNNGAQQAGGFASPTQRYSHPWETTPSRAMRWGRAWFELWFETLLVELHKIWSGPSSRSGFWDSHGAVSVTLDCGVLRSSGKFRADWAVDDALQTCAQGLFAKPADGSEVPVLVLSPPSLLQNWARELRRWGPFQVEVIPPSSGQGRLRALQRADAGLAA